MNVLEIDPEQLLSLYSIVFQDVTLFNNTIMENIRIGKKDATDEEVMAAAKLANCVSVEMIADKFSNATWNGSYILDTTSRYMKNVNASISPFANKIPPTKVVVPIPGSIREFIRDHLHRHKVQTNG